MGANTTAVSGSIIQITPHSTYDADWIWSTEMSEWSHMNWMLIRSIQFNPSAQNDVMIIHDGGLDGPEIFNVKCTADTDQRIKYFDPPLHCEPYIDASDCTLGTPENARIYIEIA